MRAFTAIAALVLLAGCQSAAPRDFTPTYARFYLESTDPRVVPITLPKSGVKLSLAATPVLTEGDIVNVETVQVDLGRCLLFQLTPAATRDLYRFSVVNQGGRLALTINGAAFGARRIDGPIADGRVFVFAEIDDASLPTLVENLKKTSAEVQLAARKK